MVLFCRHHVYWSLSICVFKRTQVGSYSEPSDHDISLGSGKSAVECTVQCTPQCVSGGKILVFLERCVERGFKKYRRGTVQTNRVRGCGRECSRPHGFPRCIRVSCWRCVTAACLFFWINKTSCLKIPILPSRFLDFSAIELGMGVFF